MARVAISFVMLWRKAFASQYMPFQPKIKRRHITLKERLKDFNGQYEFEEWNTGEPVGSEIIDNLENTDNMLKKGEDTKTIAEYTNFTADEVEKLK